MLYIFVFLIIFLLIWKVKENFTSCRLYHNNQKKGPSYCKTMIEKKNYKSLRDPYDINLYMKSNPDKIVLTYLKNNVQKKRKNDYKVYQKSLKRKLNNLYKEDNNIFNSNLSKYALTTQAPLITTQEVISLLTSSQTSSQTSEPTQSSQSSPSSPSSESLQPALSLSSSKSTPSSKLSSKSDVLSLSVKAKNLKNNPNLGKKNVNQKSLKWLIDNIGN